MDSIIIACFYPNISHTHLLTPMYNGQSEQDKFVLKVLKEKKNGFFLEIGSNDAIHINNSYPLEINYGWRGFMVEYEDKYLESYKMHRPNSIHIIQDATQVDYAKWFEEHNAPLNVDYLQIDLEAQAGSTLKTLQKLDAEIFDRYTFATVTFEHDRYDTLDNTTRECSRAIFEKRGYVRVLEDISNTGNPYEDWYVHPSLVDMSYIETLMEINRGQYVVHPLTGKRIEFSSVLYP